MAEWWLGARVAQIRQRRGMPQDELANKVGLSQNYISKFERGDRIGMTVVTFCDLVDALDMEIRIAGKSKAGKGRTEGDSVKEQDGNLILPLRRLLLPVVQVVSSFDEEELTCAKLRKRVLDCAADFNKARYVKLAADIPTLVVSIETAIGLNETEAKADMYRLLAETYILAAETLIWLRNEDLACEAIRRAMGAAENAGDPVLRASAGRDFAWIFTRLGMFDDAQKAATDLAAEIGEPSITKSTPEHLAVWGRLITAASRAAAFNNRPDTANELLDYASGAAGRIGARRMDYGKYWAVFSPTKIAISRAENALIGGDAGLALALGKGIRRIENLYLDTWTGHLLAMARAQTSTRDYAGAIKTMKDIRGLAPEWIKNHRVAHDVVLRLLDAVSVRRARNSGLAELAQFMGVEP